MEKLMYNSFHDGAIIQDSDIDTNFYYVLENGEAMHIARVWTRYSVKEMCEKLHYYGDGTNEEFLAMLDMVENGKPDLETMYKVARDIANHSEKGCEISNVMFELERLAVYTMFDI